MNPRANVRAHAGEPGVLGHPCGRHGPGGPPVGCEDDDGRQAGLEGPGQRVCACVCACLYQCMCACACVCVGLIADHLTSARLVPQLYQKNTAQHSTAQHSTARYSKTHNQPRYSCPARLPTRQYKSIPFKESLTSHDYQRPNSGPQAHLFRYVKHSMSSMWTSSTNSTPGTSSATPAAVWRCERTGVPGRGIGFVGTRWRVGLGAERACT